MEGSQTTSDPGEPNVLLEVFPGAFLLGGATALIAGVLQVAAVPAHLGQGARDLEQVALAV
ncbi:hypothetical protein N9293_00625, partial [Planctomycetota bacterium]|nr:hypothetical protein [Planctomycetota bacterium]